MMMMMTDDETIWLVIIMLLQLQLSLFQLCLVSCFYTTFLIS